MCREGEWQSQHRSQLRAEAARSQEKNWNVASLPGNRFHRLTGPFGAQVGAELFQKSREIVTRLLQSSTKRSHGLRFSARSPSQP